MVKCKAEGCETGALFGIKRAFATRCKKHGEKDMVHNSRGYCSHENPHSKCEKCRNDLVCGFDSCGDKSMYGKKQGFPIRCKIEEHRDEGMVLRPRRYCEHNKVRSHCKQCGGSTICSHNRQRNYYQLRYQEGDPKRYNLKPE